MPVVDVTSFAEEPCSTSPVEADADPLICPQGYFCSIYDNGDPKKGIPNQGVCAKLSDDEVDSAGDSLFRFVLIVLVLTYIFLFCLVINAVGFSSS